MVKSSSSKKTEKTVDKVQQELIETIRSTIEKTRKETKMETKIEKINRIRCNRYKKFLVSTIFEEVENKLLVYKIEWRDITEISVHNKECVFVGTQQKIYINNLQQHGLGIKTNNSYSKVIATEKFKEIEEKMEKHKLPWRCVKNIYMEPSGEIHVSLDNEQLKTVLGWEGAVFH